MSKSFERFKLSGGDRVVILQSNRPMLQEKGLGKKPITWKVVEGEVKDPKALDKLILLNKKRLNGEQEPQPPVPKTHMAAREMFRNQNMRKKGGSQGTTLGEKVK